MWRNVGDIPPKGWTVPTKYLYTVATAAGWPHEAVKKFIKASFDKDSTKDLTYSEYNATLEVVSEPYEPD
jgi:hypothetical protein